jgi:hypothetical protein
MTHSAIATLARCAYFGLLSFEGGICGTSARTSFATGRLAAVWDVEEPGTCSAVFLVEFTVKYAYAYALYVLQITTHFLLGVFPLPIVFRN